MTDRNANGGTDTDVDELTQPGTPSTRELLKSVLNEMQGLRQAFGEISDRLDAMEAARKQAQAEIHDRLQEGHQRFESIESSLRILDSDAIKVDAAWRKAEAAEAAAVAANKRIDSLTPGDRPSAG